MTENLVWYDGDAGMERQRQRCVRTLRKAADRLEAAPLADCDALLQMVVRVVQQLEDMGVANAPG